MGSHDTHTDDRDIVAAGKRLDEIAAAEAAVKTAEQNVWIAEEQMVNAAEALRLARGKLLLAKERPTWKQILNPHVGITLPQIYTSCMQIGYKYASWNGKIYRAGSPGEGMVDTGAFDQDIV